MNIKPRIIRIAINSVKRAKFIFDSVFLFYPKKVECNVCGWRGRHFVSDQWHKHINCPKCRSSIRQRLFIAALENIERLSFDNIIRDKKILHFAPEEIIRLCIKGETAHYTTTDLLRHDCDLKTDISNMPEISNESFDVVIAFDVLEHVSDYKKALEEVNRILL